jgi:hypothetical protein
MVTQVARPRLQHAQQAEGAADVAGVGRQRLERLLGGAEEQVIHDLLVTPRQRTQAPGDGEGGQEIADGQHERPLLGEPVLDLLVLTLGTVAVLAGVVLVVILLALGAAVQVPAEGRGATGRNILDGPPVAGEEPGVVLGEIGRAMQAENVRQLRHRDATDPP